MGDTIVRYRNPVVCPGAVATNIRNNSGLSNPNKVESGEGMKALSPAKAARIKSAGSNATRQDFPGAPVRSCQCNNRSDSQHLRDSSFCVS